MTLTPTRWAALLATSAALIAAPLAAQEKPPVKPPVAEMDHSKMDHSKMDHGAAKAADADLKAGLKGLHDRFDVLEGCAGAGMKHSAV